MSLLQQYIMMSEAGFSLTAFIQLALLSVLGFVVVKAVSRQSAPLRSLVTLLVMASLALTLIISTAFHFSNISWCKTEKVRPVLMQAFTTAAMPELPMLNKNTSAVIPEPLPHKKQFDISYGQVAAVIGIIWLAGMAVMLLELVYGLIFLHGFKYGLTPVKDSRFDALMGVVAEKFGRSKVPLLYTSSRVESPITIGISNPIVIIPEKLLGKLSDNEMKSILLHELAHIYSCDHLAGVFKRIVIAANWWNPLVYIISTEHSVAREEVADNYVLLELHPKAYSECLAGLAEKTCLINSFPAAAGMAGKYSSLEQRVKNILSRKRKLVMTTSKYIKMTALSGCCVLAVSIAGIQYASAESTPPKEIKSNTDEAGKKAFDISEKSIKAYLEFINKMAESGKYNPADEEILKKNVSEEELKKMGMAFAFYQMSRIDKSGKSSDWNKFTTETKALYDKYGPEIEKISGKIADAERKKILSKQVNDLTNEHIKDIGNLKQIGLSLFEYAYAHGNNGKFPDNLAVLIKKQYANLDIFQSPASKTPTTLELLEQNKADYMYIKGTGKFPDIMSLSTTPLVMTRPGLFGNDYVVMLYADGHVEGFDASNRNKKNENSEKSNSDGTHRITMNVTPTEGEKGLYLVELKIFEKDKTGKETVLAAPKIIITEGKDGMIRMAEEPSGDGLHCKVTSAKIDDNNLEVKVTAYKQLDGKKTFELSELQKIKRKTAK